MKFRLTGALGIIPIITVKKMMNELKDQDSSCLGKMENSIRVDYILELGRKLVAELGLDNSVDTLGRWMAHYIAELISKAEESSGEAKVVAENACFAAVLSLWQHRAELPNGTRPFEELEPVLRTIESLEPEREIYRYHRSARPQANEEVDTPEQQKWLDLAEGLDYSAKLLIGYCLSEAANAALDKSKKWVGIAEVLGDNSASEIAIQFLLDIDEVNKAHDPNEKARSQLSERIQRLRGFISAADSLANNLEERLKNLPPA